MWAIVFMNYKILLDINFLKFFITAGILYLFFLILQLINSLKAEKNIKNIINIITISISIILLLSLIILYFIGFDTMDIDIRNFVIPIMFVFFIFLQDFHFFFNKI